MSGQCKKGLIGTGIVETLETLCVDSPDIGVRRGSAEALYMINDPRSRALFRSQIKLSNDPFMRGIAASHLAKEWRKDEAEDVIQALLVCLAVDDMRRHPPGIAGSASMELYGLAKRHGVAEPPREAFMEAPEKRVELVKQWWAANKDAVIRQLPEVPQPKKAENSATVPGRNGQRIGVMITTRAASQPSSQPSITTQPAAAAPKPAR